MTTRTMIGGLAAACLLATGAFVALAAEPPAEEPATYEADRGPDKVDVSGFPAQIQQDYLVFATRCATCHTLARAINTDQTPAAWKRYVGRMLNKPGSDIAVSDGQKIRRFLTFWQVEKDKRRAGGMAPAPKPSE